MAREPAKKFTTHEAYFEVASPEARVRLTAIQNLVAELFPQAMPCISYNIPAFKTTKVFFYFAGFKNHIGIYPPLSQDKNLIVELQLYRNEKGNLAFPFKEQLPVDLIRRVAAALFEEYHGAKNNRLELLAIEIFYFSNRSNPV